MVLNRSINFAGGAPLSPLTIDLDSGQVAIRSVIVDCTQSPVGVTIYQGTSPSGDQITVAAGAYRCIPVNGTSQMYVSFPTQPNTSGSIYIAWSDQEQQGYGSNVTAISNLPNPLPISAPSGGLPITGVGGGPVSASVSGSVAITGTPNVAVPGGVAITNTPNVAVPGGVAVTGTPNVAVTNQPTVGKASDIPTNATPVSFTVDCAFTSSATTQNFGVVLLTYDFYLTQIGIWGFKRTPLWWQVQWQTGTTTYTPVFTGSEDGFFQCFPPIVLPVGTVIHPQLRLAVFGTIIGTLNAEIFTNGYYI